MNRIDEIVRKFDSEKVAAMMKAIGWGWASELTLPTRGRPGTIREKVVSPSMIEDAARRLLKMVKEEYERNGEENNAETGGIAASIDKEGLFSLEFKFGTQERRSSDEEYYYI